MNVLGNKEYFMGKRKQRDNSKQQEDMTLVDGYYIPKRIADPYKILKQGCLKHVQDELDEKGYSHQVMTVDSIHYLVVDIAGKVCRVELSPQHVSQLEKALGTTKMIETLEMIKEHENG